MRIFFRALLFVVFIASNSTAFAQRQDISELMQERAAQRARMQQLMQDPEFIKDLKENPDLAQQKLLGLSKEQIEALKKAEKKSLFGSDAEMKAKREKMQAAVKAANPTLKNLPETLNGLFGVTQSGMVFQMMGRDEELASRIVLMDQFSIDAGKKVGDIQSRVAYSPHKGTFKFSEALTLSPSSAASYAHCKAIYNFPVLYKIVPITMPNGQILSDQWKLAPIDKRHCAIPRTHQWTCQTVSCDRYDALASDAKSGIIVRNREQAITIGKALIAKAGKDDYANAVARLNKHDHERQAAQPDPKGYFERGGACGDISCNEADVNQFLIDEYW